MNTNTTTRRFFGRLARCAAASIALSLMATPMVDAQTPTDYETLPPDPAHNEQVLSAAPVSMAKAMELAASASKGTVLAGNALIKGDAVTYEIVCAVDGTQQRVVVDGTSGNVTAVKVSVAQAAAAALKAVDGTMQSVVSDFAATPPSYSVVVLHGGKIHTISIDAVDGKVTSDTQRGQFPGEDFTGELVTLPSGLKYFDIVEGAGPAPASAGAVVEVHYTGYLVDGTKFDSSVDRGQPASFPLGNVIKGWTEGVGSMKVGGKRKLVIPYTLAYGPNGRAPVIPAKATLIFDVELLKIVSNPDSPAAPVAPANH